MLFKCKTIDDLVGFTEICDSTKLLSVIGSACGLEDLPSAWTEEMADYNSKQMSDWACGGKHLI